VAFWLSESQNQNKRIDANGNRFNASFVGRLQTLWFRGLVCMTCCLATVVEGLSLDSQLRLACPAEDLESFCPSVWKHIPFGFGHGVHL
jgi:hypothetical protein